MELRQLKYFVKVARTLNFSEAAKQLYVTQSTLSQQIKQLETELGTTLFVRSSHSVSLTEAGNVLLSQAQRTIVEADLCAEKIADLNALAAGELNIGVTYSFSPILTETIVSFIRQYPRIKLNITYKPMAELMQLLKRRDVDFVLAFKPSQPVDGVESHILFQTTLSVVVGQFHPLAALPKVSVDKLAQYDLALPSKGLQARNAFDNTLAALKDFRVRIELNEVNILLKLLRTTNMATVLSEATVYNEQGVVAVPLDLDGCRIDGCVHTLAGSYHKRSMQEFIRMLGESVAVRDRRNAWL